MRNIALFSIFTLTISAFLIQCKPEKDPCEVIICENGGTCQNGVCLCQEYYYGGLCNIKCVNGSMGDTCECKDGWQGGTCETEIREKFLGTYSVHETCYTGGNYNYSTVVSKNSGGTRYIEFTNFRGDNTYAPIVAVVDANKHLTIDAQYPKGVQQVSGTGFMNEAGDTITIEYEFKASQGANKEICTLKFY